MGESLRSTQQLGRYRLVTTLGQGGMGTIWLALAGGLGEFRKLLVVKELRSDLTRNPRFVEMFLDEAKLAARLNHPNVVQTLEAGQEEDRYFLSMEFLDGQPLSEVLQRASHDPQISLGMRLRIMCGALAGLHYAHELRDYDGTDLQIVHRDVSPQNVFVTYDGQVKVVDFGIAKAADADTFTQPGVFKGKFAYASPEQVKGQPVDRRADLFAMGVLLWECVTLQRFARGKPSQSTIESRLNGAEPRLAKAAPDVEPLLAEICDRAMQVEPSARFATADEFRQALEQYLFVSGERVETTSLAKAMQVAFAEERAAMLRMINSHLKDADLSESLVRPLRSLPVEVLSPEDPTTVADLSELVESSRVEMGPGAPHAFAVARGAQERSDSTPVHGTRLEFAGTHGTESDSGMSGAYDTGRPRGWKGNKTWLGLTALAGILVLAAYAIARERSSAAPGTAVAAGAEIAPVRIGGADTPARAAAVLPAAVEAVASQKVPGPAEQKAEAALAPASPGATTAPPRVPTRPRVPVVTGLASTAPDRERERERERTSDGPGRSRDDATPTGPRTAEPAADDARTPIAEGVGEDLRRLQKSERRKLDLEDPFQ